MEILPFLKDAQHSIAEKVPISIYLKRLQRELGSEENLNQLIQSQGFQLSDSFAWEKITAHQAKEIFILVTSHSLTTSDIVFDNQIAFANWEKLLTFLSSETQFYTNIAGADSFINGDSYGWHGIANTNFEVALALVDAEMVLVFHVAE